MTLGRAVPAEHAGGPAGSSLAETEARLLPAPLRAAVVAGLLSAAAVGVAALVYLTGRFGAMGAVGEAVRPAAGGGSPAQVVWRLLLAVCVVGAVATLFGAAARRLGQPPVVGEMVAGLLLGPSLLGALGPGVFHALLPAQVRPGLAVLAQIGLAIFMYTVGHELDGRVLDRQRGAIASASLAMMAVPFTLGVVCAVPLYRAFAGPAVPPVPFVVFIGTALSVTAFPVLARIVLDSGLRGTRLGSLAIVCAAFGDVLAWCALAVVLAMIHARGPAAVLTVLALTVALALACLLGMRPLVRMAAMRYADRDVPVAARAMFVLAVILGLAAAADRIGVHAIFGGFLAGLVLPRELPLFGEVGERIGRLNRAILVPVFFASIGLQTDLRAAVGQPTVVAGGALLLATAVAGKVGSAVPVGLAGGLPRRHAVGLGVLMNARGVTEIVVLSAGLSAGVINRAAFAVLVVMALVTTAMAAPALRLLGVARPTGGPRWSSRGSAGS